MTDINLEVRAAVDDAVKGLAEVNAELGDLEATGKRAAAGTERASLSLDDLEAGVNLAREALGTLKGVYDDVIGGTIAYADEVRDLGRTIGATTEETSKLIQAADDVKVSYATLSQGLEVAIRKGVAPTVAGIGELADAYNAIQDPIKRTKFLMDNFGRSGADLAPLMERGAAGIRELGKAAEEVGLVMSAEQVQNAREYSEAVDELADSWMGLKVAIGNAVIPAINDLISTSDENIARSRAIVLAQYGIVESSQATSAEMEILSTGVYALNTNLEQTVVNTEHYSAALLGMGEANQEFLDSLDKLIEVRDLAARFDALHASMQPFTLTAENAAAGIFDMAEQLGIGIGVLEDFAVNQGLVVPETVALNEAMDKLAGVTGEFSDFKQARGLEAIADAVKTGVEPAVALNDAINNANYNLGLLAPAWAGATETISAKTPTVTESVDELGGSINLALSHVLGFEQVWGRLESKEITLTVYGLDARPGSGGGRLNPLGTSDDGKQSGGLVAGGRDYLVGEQGPELMRAPAGGGMVVNQYNTNHFNSEIDVASWMMRFARQVREYRG